MSTLTSRIEKFRADAVAACTVSSRAESQKGLDIGIRPRLSDDEAVMVERAFGAQFATPTAIRDYVEKMRARNGTPAADPSSTTRSKGPTKKRYFSHDPETGKSKNTSEDDDDDDDDERNDVADRLVRLDAARRAHHAHLDSISGSVTTPPIDPKARLTSETTPLSSARSNMIRHLDSLWAGEDKAAVAAVEERRRTYPAIERQPDPSAVAASSAELASAQAAVASQRAAHEQSTRDAWRRPPPIDLPERSGKPSGRADGGNSVAAQRAAHAQTTNDLWKAGRK